MNEDGNENVLQFQLPDWPFLLALVIAALVCAFASSQCWRVAQNPTLAPMQGLTTLEKIVGGLD
jgi:hypothetical protein